MKDTIKYPSGNYSLLSHEGGWVHRGYKNGLNFYFTNQFHPNRDIVYYICHRPEDPAYYIFLRDDARGVLSKVNGFPSLEGAKVGYVMANKVIDMMREQV